ncbi:MAG: glycosyltransferase family 4 protein [Acidobacteria bacterium]|nr:glycosyltransferase family 4 protein [Acidobacteriota bacterium]
MRIGFDVSQTAEARAGCGVFQAEMLGGLARVVEADASCTIVPMPVFSHYRHPEYRRAVGMASERVDATLFRKTWAELNAAWDGPPPRAARLGHVDLVHSNSFGCPRDLGVPLVYTVYDLSPLDHPEFHTEANRLVCFEGLFDASLRADAFVAISAFTRDRFLHWFPHVEAARVDVVGPAARAAFTHPPVHARSVLTRLGLEPGAFFLAVGTIEPRKNYRFIIEAYLQLLEVLPDAPPLCIAGQQGWLEDSPDEWVRGTRAADRIRTLGFVPDEELAVLYRETVAFVFASHYEGFGLPLVEALACGAAVVATSTATVPEVLGDAAYVVAPGDAGALAEALRRLVTDVDIRRGLAERAQARSAAFSWDAAARHLLDVYRRVLEDGRTTA